MGISHQHWGTLDYDGEIYVQIIIAVRKFDNVFIQLQVVDFQQNTIFYADSMNLNTGFAFIKMLMYVSYRQQV